MNKKFMVVALMAALSTVGYGAWHENTGAIDKNNKPLGFIGTDKGNDNFAHLKEEVDRLSQTNIDMGNLVTNIQLDKADKSQVEELEGRVEKVEDKVNTLDSKVNNAIGDINNALTDVQLDNIDQDNAIADLDNKVNNAIGDINNALTDVQLDNIDQDNAIADLTNNKLDKEQYENDKAAQAEIDASQQSEIAGLAGQIGNLGNTILQNKEDQAAIDKSQNETIDGLNQQIGDLANNKADKAEVEDLKDQVEKNEQAIQGNTQQIVDLHEKDKELQGQIDTNKKEQAETDKAQNDRIDTNTQNITALQDKFAGYEGRLSGLEKKVDNLDNKMNKGLSLMAAMNAVDFQNVQTGEMALGAGIGHYGNAQSVALGVAYAPAEDLTVNAKYSITAGDPDSFAVGAGATYKFKVGR